MVGQVPQAQGTPELYILVVKAGAPYLCVALYADSEQLRCFQEAIIWSSWAVIGYGSRVHFISISDGTAKTVELNDYFGYLYPEEDFLLVASGSGLIRFDKGARVVWRNDNLGIDGVLVKDISDEIVTGEGEWDPPGGWKPFQVSLESGEEIE
jgi:hypothetical protein